MTQLTDGRQAAGRRIPGGRYWAGVLLGVPLAIAVPGTALLFNDGSPVLPAIIALAVVLAGFSLILQERTVRELSRGWWATWALAGLALSAAATVAYAAAGFVVGLAIACHGVEQCL